MSKIKDNEHAPDVQAGKESALSGSLATGSSTEGMSGNVNPDGASLSEGFAKVSIAGGMADQREGDEMGYAPTQTGGGVVGRPGGWER